jgi:6-phosphofructokinase 1
MDINNDFIVENLGKCSVKSPLGLSSEIKEDVFSFIRSDERVIYDTTMEGFLKFKENNEMPLSFEKAGPREYLYFEPAKTKVAVVTCGGLCPGLNNVIRSLVLELNHRYGISRITGIKYGFEGLISSFNHSVVELTPSFVDDIHLFGGTILGSSRGNQDIGEMVDALERMNINILFCIGGDGTLKGAHVIAEEIKKRNLKISIVGIPKTIDNDISYIDKSFGFETAFSIAHEIIRDAHNEAVGAYNGISLIKLMGRDSGFIAASASISMQEVNFVIVPELDFDLYGGRGFFKELKKRLQDRNHALIVVAEGAGQFLFEEANLDKDASGNIKHKDIGILLKDKINEEFGRMKMPITLKYIDPSYIIRSAAANANDSKFCSRLAQNAVHGALAGKTDFVVGHWNDQFTYLPIPIAVKERKKIKLNSELWWNVLEATGQPMSMKNN